MSYRTLSRRCFLKASGAVIAGAALAACAGATTQPQVEEKETAPAVEQPTAAPAAAEPVTIRHGWWIGADSEWYRTMERVRDKFQEANPDIKVQLESSGWADYWQRVQVQMAGGEAIDVMWTSGAYFANLQEKGVHLELTPYVERDEFDYSQYITQAEFFPEDKVWTMPYTGWAAAALVYNMYAFDEAGLAYPTNEWTWDDWRQAAIALTKRDDSGNVTQWGQWIQFGAEYGWLRYLRHNGADYMNEDFDKTTMDDPKAIEAIQWILDQVFEYKCAPGQAEQGAVQQAGVIRPFLSGACAMACEQEIGLDILKTEGPPENVKPQVVRMPTVEKGGLRWFNGNTNPITISSVSKNPEAAWKWALHLASYDAMQDLMATSGYPLTSVYKPLNHDAEKGFMKPIPGVEHLDLQVFVDMVEADQPGVDHWTGLDFHRKWMDWYSAVHAEMDYAWLGERTAEEACKAATVAGDQVLAEA